jgi:hypothetical protein
MVRRLSIALVVVLAVLTATVRLPAQACALNMRAGLKAPCTDECCATMKSCVLSQQGQTPPAATSTNAQQSIALIGPPIQSLLVQAALSFPVPGKLSANILPDSPPSLAVLCTFLI